MPELNVNSSQLWQAAGVSKMFSRMHGYDPGKGGETFLWAAHHPAITIFYFSAEKMDAGRLAAPGPKRGWKLNTCAGR